MKKDKNWSAHAKRYACDILAPIKYYRRGVSKDFWLYNGTSFVGALPGRLGTHEGEQRVEALSELIVEKLGGMHKDFANEEMVKSIANEVETLLKLRIFSRANYDAIINSREIFYDKKT